DGPGSRSLDGQDPFGDRDLLLSRVGEPAGAVERSSPEGEPRGMRELQAAPVRARVNVPLVVALAVGDRVPVGSAGEDRRRGDGASGALTAVRGILVRRPEPCSEPGARGGGGWSLEAEGGGRGEDRWHLTARSEGGGHVSGAWSGDDGGDCD